MKLTYKLTFALLLFTFALFGQEYDFVIDPIEQEQTGPSAYDLEAGNWTGVLHETYNNESTIKASLKRKVVVYIHDTAGKFDNKYLDKAAKNLLGASYTGEDFADGHGHGTHVAGCVGGYSGDFPLGVAQILTTNDFLWLIPHKVLTNQGSGNYAWVVESMNDATRDGKKLQDAGYFVIHNLSLGGSTDYAPLQAAITAAREAGQLVIIAAGNTGGTPVGFPGRADNANAIAAVDQAGNRAYFSSYGNEVYISGGGVNVLSTTPNNQLAKMSGTSMASPTIAGFAAIIAATNPTATANQIERFIAHYATGEKWNEKTGWGIPKYSNYIGKKAIDEPDTPLKEGNTPDPEPEKPTREIRYLAFNVPTYTTIWKTASGAKFQTVKLNFEVSINSNLYDEAAYDAVKAELDWFFTNRGFVLLDHMGFKDAGYYSAYFAEMLINKRDSKLGIKIQNVIVTDEKGRTARHERRTAEKLATRMQMLSAFQPYTLIYNQ